MLSYALDTKENLSFKIDKREITQPELLRCVAKLCKKKPNGSNAQKCKITSSILIDD